jgi:hypothetical protein
MHIFDGYLNPHAAALFNRGTAFFFQVDLQKGDKQNGSSSLASRK